MFAAMIAALVVIGFWPQPLITTARQTVTALEQVTVASDLGAPADDAAADTEARE
jgi:NADH:ubiquinone oxidoreductase subunit 4 (subunit M)